jgi:hypothetical protein
MDTERVSKSHVHGGRAAVISGGWGKMLLGEVAFTKAPRRRNKDHASHETSKREYQ